MLKNDNRILATISGDTTYIFKSQIVDSYIENNYSEYQYIKLSTSGITASNPLNTYYKTPTAPLKYTLSSDVTNYQICIPATNESSYKKFYFSCNLDALTSICFTGYGNICFNGYYHNGDLFKFMEQFPNLQELKFQDCFVSDYFPSFFGLGYIGSQFNTDISNCSFPPKIEKLVLNDNSLYGDVETFKNFENIKELGLFSTPFVGSLSNIGLTDLDTLFLYNTYDICGNLVDLINDNPDFKRISLINANYMSSCLSDMDVSNFTYINLDIPQNFDFSGSITNWSFNTGLTYFGLQFYENACGDLTNLDFSNTNVKSVCFSNLNEQTPDMYGSLSGWTLPNTIECITFANITGITSIMQDFSSNPNLSCFAFWYTPYACQDINNFIFPSGMSCFSTWCTSLYGDIGQFVPPTCLDTLGIEVSHIGGNISEFEPNEGLRYLYLSCNNISGNSAMMGITENLFDIYLYQNSGITFNLNEVTNYNTCNLNNLDVSYTNCVCGDLSKIIIPYNLDYLSWEGTPSDSDLSTLDYSKIGQLCVQYSDGLYGDLN